MSENLFLLFSIFIKCVQIIPILSPISVVGLPRKAQKKIFKKLKSRSQLCPSKWSFKFLKTEGI